MEHCTETSIQIATDKSLEQSLYKDKNRVEVHCPLFLNNIFIKQLYNMSYYPPNYIII